MAHIPVEKKSGMPWWVWLLLLPLLGLLAWFLIDAFTDDDDDVDVYEDQTEAVVEVERPELMAVYDGTITELNTLVMADGVAAVAGRRVDLDDITVRSLTGDSTFVVSPAGSDDRFLVVMRNMGEQQTGDGTGSDGIHNIDEGDEISLTGSVVDPARMPREAWGMDSGDMRSAFYIRANTLDKE